MKIKRGKPCCILAVVLSLFIAAAASAAPSVEPASYVSWDVTQTVKATGGGVIEVDDINIDVNGDYICGIEASGSSTVTGAAKVTTSGMMGYGLYAANGSSIDLTGSITTDNHQLAYGAYADGQSYIRISGDIETQGLNSHGVYARNKSSIDISGDIWTENNAAYGAYLQSQSSVDIAGNITTSGNASHGIHAETGSTVNVAGDIKTEGAGARGINASGQSTVVMTGDIETTSTAGASQANGAVAAYATGSNLDITGKITTAGNHAYGAYAYINGNIVLNGDIETEGYYAYGAYANNKASADITGSIITSGNGAHGGYANDNANMKISGDITTKGFNARGVYALLQSAIKLTGNIVTASTAAATAESGAVGAYAFGGSSLDITGDITTVGNYAHGAYASSDSYVVVSGEIRTAGNGAKGVYAADSSMMKITGDIKTESTSGTLSNINNNAIGAFADRSSMDITGNITTSGNWAYGAYASNSNLILSGDIVTEGQGAKGAYATDSSVMKITGDITTASIGYATTSDDPFAHFRGSAGAFASESSMDITGNITTTGNYAYGAFAYDNSNIVLSGDILTEGDSAWGAYVEDQSAMKITGNVATTSASGTSITDSAGGVAVINRSYMDMAGNITTSGDYAYGAYVAIANMDLAGNITTEGNHATGVWLFPLSSADITGNILTQGDGAKGALVSQSTLKLSGDITTTSTAAGTSIDDGAAGIVLYDRGFLEMTGDITTASGYGYGAHASQKSSADITGNIATKGDNALGAYAYDASAIVLSGDIVTEGAGAYGAYAHHNSSIDIRGDVETSGNGAFALVGENGYVTLTNRNVKAAGANAGGIVASGDTGLVEMTGGTLAVADGWYLQTENNGTIQIEGLLQDNSGANFQLLRTASSGNVFAENSDLSGNVLHEGTDAGILSLSLTNSDLTGAVHALSANGRIDLTLNDSNWTVTGESFTNGALNVGTGNIVDFTPAPLGSTVTVSSLTGDAAQFFMKTNIETQQGDKLVVTGTSDGSHTITVANQGGAAVNGKERVTLVETADTGSDFTLTNGAIELGAYVFTLQNVEDGLGGQIWELYGRGSTPDNPTLSNATSAAVSTLIGSYLLAYQENDTLMQRLGDLRGNTMDSGLWFRAFGGKFESDKRRYARAFDMDTWGVQIGYDRKLEKSLFKSGSTYAGAYFGLGNGDMSFDDTIYSTGDVDHKTLGAYVTYIGDNGWYVDAVARYIWSETKFSAKDTAGVIVQSDELDTGGFGLSLEAGKRFRFGATGKNGGRWYMEPQAQLTWQRMGSGTYNTSSGLRIGADDYDSLIGRVGFLLGFESAQTNLYAKFSYLKEFNGDIDVWANGARLGRESLDDDWFVYGIGVTHRMNERNALYLDLERSSGGDFEQDWRINGGWRISF